MIRVSPLISGLGSLEDLIRHGLHALRETLQQDKELNVLNTSIGVLGPGGVNETTVSSVGSFRILEGDSIEPYLASMSPKEPEPVPTVAPTSSEDVPMSD